MRPRRLRAPNPWKIRRLLLALALVGAALACVPSSDGTSSTGPGQYDPATGETTTGGGSDGRDTATTGTITARLGDPTALPSPAGPDAGEPNLRVGPDGRVWLSWIEASPAGHALRFASLDPTAPDAPWSATRTIAESEGFFVNWADFPSLLVLGDGTLVAHWLQREGEGYAYGVRLSRSTDGGASWSEPVTPHHDGTLTEHGFVSLVAEPNGGFTAVWLDGRDYADAEPAPGGDGPPAAEMSLRASSFAADGTQGPVDLLDPRICDCCQTSAARVGNETLVVYRDRSPEEIRDIWAVTRGPEGWREPVRVARDDWRIPGCPVNGPSVASRGERAAVAWFALRQGRPEVKVTFTDDAGRTFSDPILVHGAGGPGARGRDPFVPLGRVDVGWLDDRTVAVSWLAGDGGDAEIRLLPVTVDGATGEPVIAAVTRSARSSGFPRFVVAGGRLMMAWTDPGSDDTLARVRLASGPVIEDGGPEVSEPPSR